MSHPVNDRYFEDILERFLSSTNGFERCTLLAELYKDDLKRHRETLVGEWYIERSKFLEERGIEEKDVMKDDDDPILEYYYEEEELGTPGDDYQITKRRIDVPRYLNVDYWIDYKNLVY